MDTRLELEKKQEKEKAEQEEPATGTGVQQKEIAKPRTVSNIAKKATNNVNEDTESSEPKTTGVCVLLLGNNCREFEQYVEIVMSAKNHLSKTGYNVVGAFMTVKATELPKPSNNTHSNSEYTKMSEACKNLRTELADWIKIAPASVMASNSREFAEIMHTKLTEISYGGA